LLHFFAGQAPPPTTVNHALSTTYMQRHTSIMKAWPTKTKNTALSLMV